MFLARIAVNEYEIDSQKIGWLWVWYKGELRLAMPKMRFGAFEMPSKEWVDKFGNLLGVWIVGQTTPDPRDEEAYLVWDGFAFLNGSTVPKEALDSFPYVRLYFTESWTMVFNDKKDENVFKVLHQDGSVIKIDRTKDAGSIAIVDGTLNNKQLWDKEGTILIDTFGNQLQSTSGGWKLIDKFGNKIELGETGIKVTDKFGHVLELAQSGSKVDGDYMVLKPTLDWILQSATTFGMGNMGLPVPIMPAHVTEANKGVSQKENFVSNKE